MERERDTSHPVPIRRRPETIGAKIRRSIKRAEKAIAQTDQRGPSQVLVNA